MVGSTLAGLLGLLAWRSIPRAEPFYQRKRLTQWLEAYNQAGSMEETRAVSRAIRAMGTNTLPYLLTDITHQEPVWSRPRPNSKLQLDVADFEGPGVLANLAWLVRHHPNAQVRLASIEAILGDQSVWIMDASNGPSVEQAAMAAQALRKALKDSDPKVRRATAQGLPSLQVPPP